MSECLIDIGRLLRGQVEDMEGGRENNACFSVPSPSQVTWDGVHFGGSRAIPKSPCLQSIREKKKSRCAVSSLQGSKRRQAVRISALPELPPELCYANSHEFLDIFFFFDSCNQLFLLRGTQELKILKWTGRENIWIGLSKGG